MALSAANTGHSGTLTASGGLGTTAPNQIIQNLRITGRVQIYHPGVIIRNCEIIGNEPYYTVFANDTDVNPTTGGVTLENCTIRGVTNPDGTIVQNGPAGVLKMVYRCNVYNVSNGISNWAAGKVINCYVHDLSAEPDAHDDGLENGGVSGVEYLYCKVVTSPVTATAAVNITSYWGPITSGLVQGCYLEGGQYTLYATVGAPGNICRVTIQDNTIKTGNFGSINSSGPDVTLINNTIIP
jgi:hypothetical protein